MIATSFQLSPDNWGNDPIATDALAASDMLRELVGNRRFVLTENMRSDAVIFQFVTSLRPGDDDARDPQEALVEARALFPVAA